MDAGKVKLALRIKTSAFDEEINELIRAAILDLGIAGIEKANADDPLINRAVITYCAFHIGPRDDAERMKRSYDEQKAQLKTAAGYGFKKEGT